MKPCLSKKLVWYSLCFALPFTLAACAGFFLDNGLHLPSLALLALVLLPLSALLFGCFLLSDQMHVKNTPPHIIPTNSINPSQICIPSPTHHRISHSSHSIFWLAFSVILLCWLPVLLAYYPGLFAYDVANQLLQYTGQIPFSTHQPLAHTLLLGWFYGLGERLHSYNIGILLYTLCQMCLLAACLAWSAATLYRRFSRRILPAAIAVLFFALFPVNSVLAISATKDVPFSGAVLAVLLLWLMLLEENAGGKAMPFLAVATAAMLLFRNNALYALLPALLLCPLLIRQRAARRRLLVATLAGVLGFFLLSGLMKRSVSAENGPMAEALSLPVQQLARVSATCAPEEETQAQIEAYLPADVLKKYDSHLSDEVKRYLKVETLSDLPGFLRLWLRVGVRYPGAYLYAFLYQTEGLWYQADVSNARIYGYGLDTRQGYLLTDTKQGFGVTHTSLFPGLEAVYERLFSENTYQRCPFLTCLFAPALSFWILLGCALKFLYRKERTRLFCCCFLLLYYGTLLLGPCALIRYMYAVTVCCPLLLSMALTSPVRPQE